MIKLHVVQAAFGDCLLLEFGNNSLRKFILIDGGPRLNFVNVEFAIKNIVGEGGEIEIMMLSHVDTDHTTGLQDLLSALRIQRENSQDELVTIKSFWINEFSSVFGQDIELRMMQIMTSSPLLVDSMSEGSLIFNGIPHGHKLQADALVLGIPINDNAGGQFISLEHISSPVEISNLKITVVGPTIENLEELKREWDEWLDANQDALEQGNLIIAANADDSIPNLSSIIVLVEGDGKSFLFTGDCRSDHLLQGLDKRGLLDGEGKLHVTVLKGQHHGSNRNVTKTFFKKVTADIYVFSANGRDGNPDLETLKWLIETAIEDGRAIRIVVTNQTESTDEIQTQFPPQQSNYSIEFIPDGDTFITI